jgi:hypothetical protein
MDISHACTFGCLDYVSGANRTMIRAARIQKNTDATSNCASNYLEEIWRHCPNRRMNW